MNKVERLEIAQVENASDEIQPLLKESNLDIVKGVKVKLEVRVGESEMTVDEFLSLGQGSVVKLDQATTAPVDLLIDGKIVARGHLVAADDNFGVRITELNT